MQGQSDQADSFKKCVEEAAVVLSSQINQKNGATTLKKLLGGLNIPRALTSEHTGQTGSKISKAFEIEPLNPYSLDNWDEDLACNNTKQSQESERDEQDRWDETEESELSEFEVDEDIENYASERAIDTKLTEDDKIEDLIYEEKLWELINGKNVMIKSEIDEKEKIAENSENEGGFSNAENQDDDDDEEEENILALDLQESSSDDESDQFIDEDTPDNLQADKTSLQDGGSPTRQPNTTSRDEGEDEDGYDEEHEGPRKRQRTSRSGRTPWARRSDADDERSRKKKRSKSEKTRYRTQEFISTSDEEDE